MTAIADLCTVATDEGLGDHRLVQAAHRWLQAAVDRAERLLDFAVVGARVATPAGIEPCECGATSWTLPSGWATADSPAVTCTPCGAERAFDAWISQAVVEVELLTAQQAAKQHGVPAATVRSWAHHGRPAPASSRGRLREGSRDRSPLYRTSDVRALVAA